MEKKAETVVSYLQDEVVDLVLDPAALDEWHALVGEMGLKGQVSVAEPDKSPVPYLFMTPSLVATFESLCPREVDMKEYSAGPIPLKALDLIKLAMREGHFQRITIRYDDKAPDPVAIGEKGHFYTYGNNGRVDGVEDWKKIPEDRLQECRDKGLSLTFTTSARYLIARWGAEAAPLEDLSQKAKERWIREQGAEASKLIKEQQARLNTLNEEATLRFNC